MGNPRESRTNFGGKKAAGATRVDGAGRHRRAGQADFLVATFFEDPPSDCFELDPLSDLGLAPESDFESDPFESDPFESEDELDAELSDFSLLRRDELGLSVL